MKYQVLFSLKNNEKVQGPATVVQSIVSVMSSLRGQLVKCFRTLLPNTLIFFVEKIFATKNIGKFQKLMFEILSKR